MPFVKKECREPGHIPCAVGDWCYLEYRRLMNAWTENRSWTTAHRLTREFFGISDDMKTAKFLAWMVWFCREVMEYEKEAEARNGEIK